MKPRQAHGGSAARSAHHAERLAFSANPLLSVKLPAWRSKLLLFVLFCGFLSLAGRALYLQGGFNTEFLQRQGEARYARTLDVPATRGRMIDRNGIVLASSVPAKAIWAIPEDVEITPEQTRELARLLDMPLTEVKRRLSNEDKSFVYLRRQVDAEIAEKIAAMKLPGIHDTREFKRHYPYGPVSAHIVGFTNVEDRGQEGMELAREKQLAGRMGSRRVIKDRLGRIVDDAWLREPLDGRDLALSLDSRVQHIAHSALKAAVERHNAKAGAVVVADTHTGEILALANWPTYDPNVRARFSPELTRNRVLTDTFEPGSTLKAFSIAAALDAGKVRPETKIQTAPGRLTIGTATIGDTRPHGLLTVEEVLAKSSNVGTAKIALELSPQALWDVYTRLGFGQAPDIGFPGAVAGRMRPARSWRPIEQATISYGHGISVSLIQLARAYTVFARDGDLIPLTLLKTDREAQGTQVLKPETAHAMRRMLEMATSPEGTAPRARISGYRIAGKTGTALKIRNGQYVKDYVASYVGFAPVSAPRLVVAVMIDEPKTGGYYGGVAAAPVFAEVAAGALRTLQVEPDGPLLDARGKLIAMETPR